MTAPMDYEGFCAGGDVEASLLASGLPRRAEEILRYRAFIRAAVPLLREGRDARASADYERRLDALTASFPNDFGDNDATV